LYSSFSSSYFKFAFFSVSSASCAVIPVIFGNSTSLGFVAPKNSIVPPNAMKNNKITPINILNFLCSLIKAINLLSEFLSSLETRLFSSNSLTFIL